MKPRLEKWAARGQPFVGFRDCKKQSRVCEKWAINFHVFWYVLDREWSWIAGSQGEPLICDFLGIVIEGFTIPKIVI